jgi:sugar lactone lactonase YvrE
MIPRSADLHPRHRIAILLFLFVAAPGAVLAAGPIIWTQQSPADFEKGKPDGIAVASRGGILLARAVREIPVKELQEDAQPFLWAQALDSKGTLYIGSGNDGRVFKITKSGQGSLFFSSGDLAVQTLAVDSRDNLFAGTSPDGKIYRITPEGKSEVWFDPEERYIWALAVDQSGNLFAATGEHGIIYKITDKSKGASFYDSAESHIVTLAFDHQGNLLAGSSGKGLLYRIAPDGKGAVLLDTALKEVNAVALDASGRVFACAIQPEPAATKPGVGIRVLLPGVGTESVAVGPTPIPTLTDLEAEDLVVERAMAADSAVRKAKSIVYRVDPDGVATTLWTSESETVFSLAIPGTKEIYVGTGDLGKIRRLDENGGTSLVARLPATQVTSLLAAPDGTLFAATSNSGGIFALEKEATNSGTYLSPPKDATSLARWGQIRWIGEAPAGAKVELFTRTGNSALPDNTWSDWSSAYAASSGSKVVSPSARFIQWKAQLTRQSKSVSPFLEAVSLTYLPANLPPRMEKIEVNPPGIIILKPPLPLETDAQETAFSQPPSAPPGAEFATPFPAVPGKRIFQKGLRSLSWSASDPNEDTLRFDIFFRQESEKEWKPLVHGLRDTYFSWDSTLMPDGRYRIKVSASDAPSNPPGEARDAEDTGPSFIVDNTPPTVEAVARKDGAAVFVEVKATDSVSYIRSLEFSLDAARWILAVPTDGVGDSSQEQYRIPLDRLPAGEHTVLLKATDTEGNVGSAKVLVSGS